MGLRLVKAGEAFRGSMGSRTSGAEVASIRLRSEMNCVSW